MSKTLFGDFKVVTFHTIDDNGGSIQDLRMHGEFRSVQMRRFDSGAKAQGQPMRLSEVTAGDDYSTIENTRKFLANGAPDSAISAKDQRVLLFD
jgi:hypothetical protein